jgi:uncharacterized protein with GYD domain
MARYLWKVSYTTDGAKGLLAEGGSSRRALLDKLISDKGGTLETFDFSLGEDDAYLIGELPSLSDVMALSLAVAASGGARVTTIPLLSPEEVDAAAKQDIGYRAPGA